MAWGEVCVLGRGGGTHGGRRFCGHAAWCFFFCLVWYFKNGWTHGILPVILKRKPSGNNKNTCL